MSDANIAFSLVLFSAFLHAGWNSVVKAGHDRLMTLALVDGTAFVLCLALVPFVALPTAEVWGFIGVSVVLNSLYRLLLVRAYDTGDFGQVYPVVRGIPPVVVAIVSAFFLAEQLSGAGYLGVVLISVGIIALSLPLRRTQFTPLAMACTAGLFIAAYTVVDALGVRASDTAFQFIVFLTLAQSIVMPTLVCLRTPRAFRRHVYSHWKSGLFGGVAYLLSYGLVLYAFSLVAVATVSALRETSVVIAAIIASLFFKEPFGLKRFLCAAVITMGIITIKMTA